MPSRAAPVSTLRRDGGRDLRRDGGRDLHRNGGHNLRRDGGRDLRRDLRRDGGRDRDQDGHDGDRGRRQPNAAGILTQTLTWLMSTGEGDS